MRRAVAVIWPVALVAAFLGTFRKTVTDAPGQAGGVDPSNVSLMIQAGTSAEASGALDRAEALYRRAAAIDPRNGDLHARLSAVLLARGDRDGARREAESALRWYPNNARAIDVAGRAR